MGRATPFPSLPFFLSLPSLLLPPRSNLLFRIIYLYCQRKFLARYGAVGCERGKGGGMQAERASNQLRPENGERRGREEEE